MNPADPELWTRLGCAPTTDPSEIRRAYARALKQIDPEHDPDAFQSLRHAFDTLLAQTAPAPAPAPDPTAFLQQLRAHRHAGDPAGAIALIDHFIAAHPPGDPAIAAASQATFDDMALERRLGAALFRHLVERFDWRDATGPIAHAFPQKHAILIARLDAEDWLDQLRADIPNPDGIAATLLAANSTPTIDPTRKDRAAIILGQLAGHAQFLIDRFDGNALARTREAIEGPPLLAAPPPLPRARVGRRVLYRLRYVGLVYGVLIVVGLVAGYFQSNDDADAPNPATQARQALEAAPELWVYLRPFNGQIQIYFTQLVVDRAALREVRYGVDKPVPDQIFQLPTTPAAYPEPITPGTSTGITAPATVRYVTVQLTYLDGTVSLVRRYLLQGEAK